MDWRFSSFLLLMFALLVGVPWATSESGLCGLAIVKNAVVGRDATTCFEFWFNRYQTLLGAIAAIVAAGVAWAGVQNQIRLSRSAVAATILVELQNKSNAYFAYARIIVEFRSCLDQIRSVIDNVSFIRNDAGMICGSTAQPSQIFVYTQKLAKLASIHKELEERRPFFDASIADRVQLTKILEEAKQLVFQSMVISRCIPRMPPADFPFSHWLEFDREFIECYIRGDITEGNIIGEAARLAKQLEAARRLATEYLE